jgi:hypothetical protein
MKLIQEVKTILDRLAPSGWAVLLAKHGLDIGVPLASLPGELAKLLPIDRTVPGFEELALDANRGVEPGVPGRSVLFHALVSADVAPAGAADFPTLYEIDVLENYIYAAARRRIDSFTKPVVAVFAYEYRPARLSPHRQHSDLAFSRAGVARVGTEAARYDPRNRSFDARPVGGDRGFAAVPARYAVFLAERRGPGPSDSVMRAVALDSQARFLFPVHKLFPGTECLFDAAGAPIDLTGLELVETHISEKLRRIHLAGADNPGRVAPLPQFDTSKPPFIRTSADSDDLVSLQKVGASVLVLPVPNPIARVASQVVAGGASEMARFSVPKADQAIDNRFWTSLQLTRTGLGRAAPEYANLRQLVTRDPHGAFVIEDLNERPDAGTAAAEQFGPKIQAGGYEAAHFVDGTCDGVISARVPHALSALQVFPAYSLVSAIDYFPQVEQVELEEWIERLGDSPIGLGESRLHFAQGGTAPLSDGRFQADTPGKLRPTRRTPNPGLPDPASTSEARAFPLKEAASQTVTAVVGRKNTAGAAGALPNSSMGASWLPDAASDIFAPGWDISQHATSKGEEFYTAYGLGSPFPEDAKLCAALNSFWPAAAPDSSRTFGFGPGATSPLATAIPLSDHELGYHPDHPRVAANEVKTGLGWDGQHGPFILKIGGADFVDAADPGRSDQTRAALDGKLGFSGLDQLTAAELIARMEELRFCRASILGPAHMVEPWLATFVPVPDWAAWNSAVVHPPLDAALVGSGYIFTFVEVNRSSKPVGDPPLRRRFAILRTIHIQTSRRLAFFRIDAGVVVRRIR